MCGGLRNHPDTAQPLGIVDMLERITAAACAVLLLSACTPSATDSQAPTEAEYRAAWQAGADCLVSKGFDARVDWSELSNDYAMEIQNTQGRDAELDEAYNECYAEHMDEIVNAYQETKRVSGSERESVMRELLECLGDLGVTGLDAGTNDSRVFVKAIWEQLSDTPEEIEAMACMERYRGVWPKGDANNP